MDRSPLAVDLDACVADAVIAFLVLAAERETGAVGAIAGGTPDDRLLEIGAGQAVGFLLGAGEWNGELKRR